MFRTIKRGNRYHFVTFKSACRFAAFCGSQALPADGNYIVFGVDRGFGVDQGKSCS
jgi:hypothetical protein